MRMTVRDYDLVGQHVKELGKEDQFAIRYGGEEFSLVLLDIESQDAIGVAERLRQRIEDYVFKYEGREIRLTTSIGLYSEEFCQDIIDQDAFLSDISKKADEALYQAKAMGKNRVVIYSTVNHIAGDVIGASS